MRELKKIALLIPALMLAGGCATGQSVFQKAQKLENEGNLDEAVVKYAEAAAADPEQREFRMKFLKTREKAADMHLKKGNEMESAKKYDTAFTEYQAALALDPTLERAKKQRDIVMKLRDSEFSLREAKEFEKNNKLREAYKAYKEAAALNPENTEAREALQRLAQSRKTKLDGYDLNLKSTKPVTIKFKDAKLKDVFNILTQLSGINFIFDEGMKDQNVSIFLENASFQQALEIITNLNKLSKKVLNENTILIFPKTPEKTKQYEELFVKTIYLNSLDAKKAVNLLRTMLQLKKIYVNEDLNALIIRDTPDLIGVAQKIIEANDVPEPEVLLEVEIVEISKSNIENFGLGLSKYQISANTWTPGGDPLVDSLQQAQSSSNSSSGTTTNPVSASNLLPLFKWNGYTNFITVPNATYNFEKRLTNAEVLSNPRIRVKNKEKSKFNVGTRVPITTTSSTGSVGGVSVNVQYVDVGVKVNAEPTIQLDNGVSIKLSLEVSSILSRDKIGAADSLTTVVTIGTRNLDTVLTLRDGETSIIGGLITDDKNKGKSKMFLIGDIPILGPLLSNNSDTNSKTELVLAITPRIIRPLAMPDAEVSGFWSGREDEPTTEAPFAAVPLEPDFAALAQPTAAQTAPQAAAQEPPVIVSAPAPTPVPPPARVKGPSAKPPAIQSAPISAQPSPAQPAAAVPPVPAPSGQPAQAQASGVPQSAAASQTPGSTTPAQPSGPQPAAAPPQPAATAAVPPAVPPVAEKPSDKAAEKIADKAADKAAGAPAVASQATQPVAPATLPAAGSQVPSPSPVGAPAAGATKTVPAPAKADQPPPARSPASRATLRVTAPQSVAVGQQVTVEIKAENTTNLFSAPFTLIFDPLFTEFVGASEGPLLKKDGKPTTFQTLVEKNVGRVNFTISRGGDAGGVSGNGTVATAIFRIKNAGPVNFGFQNVRFTSPSGDPLDVVPYNILIEAKQKQ